LSDSIVVVVAVAAFFRSGFQEVSSEFEVSPMPSMRRLPTDAVRKTELFEIAGYLQNK
jgi:hypothetical protein